MLEEQDIKDDPLFRLDQKLNLLIDFLEENQVLEEPQVSQLRPIRVFPSPPAI